MSFSSVKILSPQGVGTIFCPLLYSQQCSTRHSVNICQIYEERNGGKGRQEPSTTPLLPLNCQWKKGKAEGVICRIDRAHQPKCCFRDPTPDLLNHGLWWWGPGNHIFIESQDDFNTHFLRTSASKDFIFNLSSYKQYIVGIFCFVLFSSPCAHWALKWPCVPLTIPCVSPQNVG